MADVGINSLFHIIHVSVADSQKTFGAPLRFTTWDVPGDPRD
jgi:hypothetical protein